MNIPPEDSARAQALIARALALMQAQQWDNAIADLDAAIDAAPEPLRAAAVEALFSVCIARNKGERLIALLAQTEAGSPQAAKAALLLARNRAIGMDQPLPACCRQEVLEPALRAHVLRQAYPANELPVVLALLNQVGWHALAYEVAVLCVHADVWIEDGILEGVFALLLHRQERAAALRLLDAVRGQRDCDRRPIFRWATLLGNGAVADEWRARQSRGDKVLRFLQLGQPDAARGAAEAAACHIA